MACLRSQPGEDGGCGIRTSFMSNYRTATTYLLKKGYFLNTKINAILKQETVTTASDTKE